MVSRATVVIALFLAFSQPPVEQQLSIQGVWRPVSRTVPATTKPGERSDPFAHVPVGTQTNLQPGLMIFTARHYSRTTDTATSPRPTDGEADAWPADAPGTAGTMGTVPGQCRYL